MQQRSTSKLRTPFFTLKTHSTCGPRKTSRQWSRTPLPTACRPATSCLPAISGILGCLALLAGAPPAHGQNLGLKQVASGLSQPIFATSAPGDPSRLFIVERGSGNQADIRILNRNTGQLINQPFLTLNNVATAGEEGLLGLAFDPNYATNGKFYVDYVTPSQTSGSGRTMISSFTVSADPNIANTTETQILSFDQPQTNHNGGWIGFSPAGTRSGDAGNLYIATGDGGNGNDQGSGHIEPGGNAQSPDSLLGKMLRINVDTPPPAGSTHPNYSIPSDNVFAGSGGAPEIWALGLRNPFRDSFDRQTGDLLIGDVGQDSREEVDKQLAGDHTVGVNFGWRLREGDIQTPSVGGAEPANYHAPLLTYDHSVGRDVIGGYVYRGSEISALDGAYLFGDELGPGGGTSRIFMSSASTPGTSVDITSQLFNGNAPGGNHFSLLNLYSFAEDAQGELYILDGTAGVVYKIVPEPSSVALLSFGVGLLIAARGLGKRR